jgi:hypothetical protein
MKLRDRRVLLTGASSGIGHAMALAFAAEGAFLAVSARRRERLDRLVKTIGAGGCGRAVALVADLSRRGDAAELARRAVDALGGVDVLVNNAGIGIGASQWTAGDRDEARELFETNFWSPLALVRALVPAMRERSTGAVVNVTSMVQVTCFPLLGHYAASKAALGNATETLRQELRGSGVHVLEVIPGPVETPVLAENRLLSAYAEILSRPPIGNPADLARLVVRALGRGRQRIVYPRILRAGYEIPSIARRVMRFSTRGVDASDPRLVRSGSFGDPEAREAREAWERARSAPPAPGALASETSRAP